MIDCGEAVRRMWAYLEHALEPTPSEEFEAHLDVCKRCCGELEFSRHVRRMVAERASPRVVPASLRARVEQVLAAGRATPDVEA